MTRIEQPTAEIAKGAAHWNAYAKAVVDKEMAEYPADPETLIEKVTFTDLDLECFNFRFITFRHCDFRKCSFVECDWSSAKFENCKLSVCLFIGGTAESFDLENSDLNDCKLQHLQFGEGTTKHSKFDKTDFEHCFWDGASLTSNVYTKCIFVDCDVRECDFTSCRYHFTNLWHCTFRFCSFDDISVSGTDFLNLMGNSALLFPAWHDIAEIYEDDERTPDGCKLFSCSFSGCGLDGLPFGQSNLAGTYFYRCDLNTADLALCKGVSTSHFRYCDLAAAQLPDTVNFDAQLANLQQSALSLQRTAYFALLISISSAVTIISDTPGHDRVKLPPLGFELSTSAFFITVTAIMVALQVTLMVRAENIASAASSLPAVLPDHSPLPAKLRDSFIADICWRFLYTPTMHSRFANRSYSTLSNGVAFFVLYFQFPILILLISGAFLHQPDHMLAGLFLTGLTVSSAVLSGWGALSLVAAFRGKNALGRDKFEHN